MWSGGKFGRKAAVPCNCMATTPSQRRRSMQNDNQPNIRSGSWIGFKPKGDLEQVLQSILAGSSGVALGSKTALGPSGKWAAQLVSMWLENCPQSKWRGKSLGSKQQLHQPAPPSSFSSFQVAGQQVNEDTSDMTWQILGN